MEKISEEEIKKNWPSAVEGSIEHPELGVVHYWTGEQHGKVVAVSYTHLTLPTRDLV